MIRFALDNLREIIADLSTSARSEKHCHLLDIIVPKVDDDVVAQVFFRLIGPTLHEVSLAKRR